MEHLSAVIRTFPTTMRSREDAKGNVMQPSRRNPMGERLGLRGTASSKTFAAFEAKAQPKAHAAATAFLESRQSLVFYGPNGVGKTHLALAIANALIAQYGLYSAPVYFTTFDDALRQLRRTYQESHEGPDEQFYIERWRTVPVLILDEVGMTGRGRPSEFTRRIGYDIIDGRYRLGDKPIIITTNKPPSELGEWITESAVDRLMEMGEFIEMRGESWRLR